VAQTGGAGSARDHDDFAGKIGGHGLQNRPSPEKAFANDKFRIPNVERSSKPE